MCGVQVVEFIFEFDFQFVWYWFVVYLFVYCVGEFGLVQCDIVFGVVVVLVGFVVVQFFYQFGWCVVQVQGYFLGVGFLDVLLGMVEGGVVGV